MKFIELTHLVFIFLITTTLLTLFIYYTKWKHSRRHMYKLAAKVPFPKYLNYLPIIGHALHFIGDTEKILKSLMTGSCTPGPFTVWLSHRLFFFINTPEHMEIVLNSPKCLSKDDLYRMAETLIGVGLFSSPVPVWKRHRKIIMPTFNQRILDEFVEVFSDQAEIFTKILEKKVGQTFDVFPYVAKYGLDTVCETAMGIQIHAQLQETALEQNIVRCMEIMMLRMFIVPFHFNFVYNLTNLSREEHIKATYFKDFIDKVVVNKKAAYKEKILNENNYVACEEKPKRMVFLECLIEASEGGANFTNDELRGEVSTFMIAGSDTSATISAFALLMLGLHKDVEQKLFEEVMDVLGPDRHITYTDLPKLTYLEMVIKETMRIFPIGPSIVRRVDEDLELGQHVLPKDAGLVLCIMAIHHSPLYYKDPMKFIPERFTPEEIAKRHKYAFLPFSGGPRNCVGAKYGIMSLKALLANAVRKFTFETDFKSIEEIRLKQSLIIKSVNGFPIRVFPRQ